MSEHVIDDSPGHGRLAAFGLGDPPPAGEILDERRAVDRGVVSVAG
jgi:hypothetical protein